MTHCGPLMQKLESEISSNCQTPNAINVSSGTSALQLAIKVLNLKGEIITTPFTYIATANIINWEDCTPVFVDIDPETWNINPHLIEKSITNETTAILPVHVFSNPCDIQSIESIALKHNLKTIYDAAHAMCVNYKGKSIMAYGHISCTSFHATKVFNSCEGGACFTLYSDLEQKLRQMRFFGFDDQKEIVNVGMNAKMTELHAALGLLNLTKLNSVLEDRKAKYLYYKNSLKDVGFIKFQKFKEDEYNYSYMPILVEREITNKLIKKLNSHNIYPRKYFYPGLNKISLFPQQNKLPVSDSIQGNVICLPLYLKLNYSEIDYIIKIIKSI